MDYGRRASWTGGPRPRILVRLPHGFARLLQPGARLAGGSNFGPFSTTPTSSWRQILERSSRGIRDISNRFWAKNRTSRKQTIKPCLTGARTHIRIFGILQISAQNDDATSIVIPFTLTQEGSEAVSAGPPKSQTGLPGRRLVEPGRSNSRAWGRGREAAGIRPFLPGSAEKVECDVTHSKQTMDEFLPGATTARLNARPQQQVPRRRKRKLARDDRAKDGNAGQDAGLKPGATKAKATSQRGHLNSPPRRSKFKPARLRRASPVSKFAVTTSSLYPARPACFGGVSNCATAANQSLALVSQARFLIQISGGKSHGNCSRTAG